MPNYLLRDIDAELWKKVKLRQVRDEIPSLKDVILRLLKGYAAGEFKL